MSDKSIRAKISEALDHLWQWQGDKNRNEMVDLLEEIYVEHGGWQPIEAAPKDGTYVLICVGDSVCEGRYVENYEYNSFTGWISNECADDPFYTILHDDDPPDVWQPLPAPHKHEA